MGATELSRIGRTIGIATSPDGASETRSERLALARGAMVLRESVKAGLPCRSG